MRKFLFCFLGGLLFCMMQANAQLTVNGVAADEWSATDFSLVESPNPQMVEIAKEELVAMGLDAYKATLMKESSVVCENEGLLKVSFGFEVGSSTKALHIIGVELLDDANNVISFDYHVGSAGISLVKTDYILLLTSEAKKIRYYFNERTYGQAKDGITFELIKKSIEIENNGYTDTWKPADWVVASEIPAAVVALNSYFVAPYVKKTETVGSLNQGIYTFCFDYKSGASALRIGGVEIVDMNGNVVASDYHYGLSGLSLTNNFYTVKVKESGKYIVRYYCENKTGGNNSTGDINITSTSAIDVNGENPSAVWTHLANDKSVPFVDIDDNDVPEGVLALSTAIQPSHVRVLETLVNVSATSSINVEYQYQSGPKALNLAGVDFVNENGDVVASDYKLYDEGAGSVVSEYTLMPVVAGTYTMRTFVQLSSENGTRTIDSKGNIIFDVNTDVITVAKGDLEKEVGDWSVNTFVKAETEEIPEDIATKSSGVKVMTAMVNVAEGGILLNVKFPWTKGSGSRALDMAGVDIIDANGNVIVSDYHFTQYGVNAGTPYELNIKTPGIYVIRYFNGQEGSSTRAINSTGKVTFSAVTKEFVVATTNFSRDYYFLKNEEGKYLSTTSGAVALVAEQNNATKFYIEKNGGEYALLSFDKGLYLDFNGTLSVAAVDKKYGFELGKGFLPGNSVIIKCGEEYLTNDLSVTNDINGTISWALEEVESLSFSISSLRHASLYLPVEVEIPADVKVYIYTGIEYLENDAVNLQLERIYDYIPANTAVLLYSAWPLETTTYFDFKISKTGAASFDNNQFLGIYAKSVIKADSDKIYMYLTKPSGQEVGFYKRLIDNDSDGDGNADSFILGANKLYFTLPVAQATLLSSRRFSLSFIENGATGVDEVLSEENTEKVVYDLQGRRVYDMSVPGMYIVNGNKVLVK